MGNLFNRVSRVLGMSAAIFQGFFHSNSDYLAKNARLSSTAFLKNPLQRSVVRNHQLYSSQGMRIFFLAYQSFHLPLKTFNPSLRWNRIIWKHQLQNKRISSVSPPSMKRREKFLKGLELGIKLVFTGAIVVLAIEAYRFMQMANQKNLKKVLNGVEKLSSEEMSKTAHEVRLSIEELSQILTKHPDFVKPIEEALAPIERMASQHALKPHDSVFTLLFKEGPKNLKELLQTPEFGRIIQLIQDKNATSLMTELHIFSNSIKECLDSLSKVSNNSESTEFFEKMKGFIEQIAPLFPGKTSS